MSMINEVDSTNSDSAKKINPSKRLLKESDSEEEDSDERRFSISFGTFYDYICSQNTKSCHLSDKDDEEILEECEFSLQCQTPERFSETEEEIVNSLQLTNAF